MSPLPTRRRAADGPAARRLRRDRKEGDIDLLLHGDSITDFWVQGDANKAMFNKYFGGIKTANFAIAGDTTQGVLWGLKNGEGQGFQPKAVMLMIGTNNTGGNNNAGTATAAEIAEGIGAVVLEMRNDFPNAKILLLAVFPRGLPGDSVRDKIADINKIIAKLDDQRHVFYMDIGARFLDEKGVFPPGYIPERQPAPAGEGIRHLGSGSAGQAGGVNEIGGSPSAALAVRQYLPSIVLTLERRPCRIVKRAYFTGNIISRGNRNAPA